MTRDLPESPRLSFKRAFIDYFVELSSPAIADPTEAFAACRVYLTVLRDRFGARGLMSRLDDETTHMAGEVAQDLHKVFQQRGSQPAYDELEDRLRECFEHGLGRLDAPPTDSPVE